MKKSIRRQRMVLRLRKRANRGVELSIVEKLIQSQTSTYRTLMMMFPGEPDWLIRKATEAIESYGKLD